MFCADDVGMSHTLDDGVRDAVSRGAVLRSVSFVPRGASAQAVAPWLRETDLAVGLHVVFDGPPRVQAVEDQVLAFRDHLGRSPDFINSHRHLHLLPPYRDALLQAAVARGVARVRNPLDWVALDPRAPWRPWRSRMAAWPLASLLARGVAPAARALGLRCPDGMIGGVHMGRLSMGVMDQLWPLVRARPGVLEVVVHPHWRSAERVALTAPLLSHTLAHHGYTPIDYRAL